ncbi:MAG: hypothetical protein ACO3EZ_19375, partial [Prochlorotrichaceae cyanobacterium]
MPPLARRYGLRISLSFGLAIVFSPPVFAQDCSEAAIDQSIQQIATPEAQDALQICGEVTIAPLLKVLNRGSAPEQRSAIVVLGRLGADAADAVDPLLAVILAPDETEDVRREAIAAVADITQELADQAGDLNPWDRDAVEGVVSLSEQLAGILNGAVIPEREAFPAELRDLNAAQRQITIAAQNLTDQPGYQLSRWIVENPWIWLVVVYGGGYGFIFWLKPLWLLNLAEFQESVLENIPESIPLLRPGITALLGAILPGKYAPRILDAWVAAQLAAEAGQESAVKRRFESIATVQDRQNRVWLPVKVNGDTKADPRDFSPETLKPFFSEAIVGIWIDGEGGSGKTSLAFEIAHWALAGNLTPYRILPVLIEDEPRDDEELLTVIRLRLEALVGEKASLDETLLRNLLREKRILVILDHISEMSEGTQEKIQARNQ